MAGTPSCDRCGARLARDQSGTTCSPCRRSLVEQLARQASLITRDPDGARTAFAATGLPGVVSHLRCSGAEAVDVAIALGLVPAAYRRRRELLARLVAMPTASHVAAAELLGISRWTVAAYRRDLGLDRPDPAPPTTGSVPAYRAPVRSASAIA